MKKELVFTKLLGQLQTVFVRKDYKDRLFRRLFHDKMNLLELYNALNGTSYTNIDELEICTLEDVIYMGYRNDVSFMVGNVVSLYEHQSTLNENMPLRGLLYFARQYEGYLSKNRMGNQLYNSKRISLPFPQFVVFYNGSRPLLNNNDYVEMRLSEAFEKPKSSEKLEPSLECIVKVYDINNGHNEALMRQCRTLHGYALLVDKVVAFREEGYELNIAVELAVDQCIAEGILEEFLRKHRSEAKKMILEEFNLNAYLKDERAIAVEEGVKIGLQRGLSTGQQMKLIGQVVRKMQKELTVAQIADALEEDEESIMQIVAVAREFAPEYDIEEIYKTMNAS